MFNFKLAEGKAIVRTKAVSRNGFLDRSFMGDPILVLDFQDRICVYKDNFGTRILPADYLDEHWQLIPDKYQEQFTEKINK